MNDRIGQHSDGDEQQLAGVIRRAGARAQPGAAAYEAVQSAVRSEWRAVVAERRRRQATRWSLAAAAAVAAVAVWFGAPVLQPPGAVMASVMRVTGPVTMDSGAWWSRSVPLETGAALGVGAELRSGAGGRVALQVGGVSLRLDHDSVVALVAADRIALRQGAVYLDTGPRGPEAPLRVETPLGIVEHLGTQYETRLADRGLRILVREGRVRLQRDGQALETRAGEQLTLDPAGEVSRQSVARTDGAWAWAGEIAPAFDIENRPLPDFLRWVSRETGRELAFESADAQQLAGTVVLRGSVAGLTPAEALAAVLATTELGYSDAQQGRIVIGLK